MIFKAFQILTIIIDLYIMENSGEIFSLWVGNNAQQLAHHFYALQAEQFFDQSEDPIEHSCLWKLYDVDGQRKKPHFLTFDTEIPHLNYLRRVNQSKMIVEMEKSQMDIEHYYFPLQYKKPAQTTQISEQKDKYLYQRWQASESNYAIIDKNFVQDCDSFEYWKDIFKANNDFYEDKVRKNLESLDLLKYLTFTSDLERSGFSQELLFYLRDQCPKKDIFFFQLQSHQKNSFYEVSQLQSFSQIGTLSDVFVNFKLDVPVFRYFESQNKLLHFAPLMNCLITPMCLKDSSKDNYLSNILINPRRNIFDLAYTLPIIDKELHLQKTTNIFDFLLQDRHQKFFEAQQASKAGIDDENNIEKEQILHLLEEDNSNRINYGSDYIGLRKQVSEHPHQKVKEQLYTELISQAYIIKGHIKNFQKLFQPNCELLDLKYLQGILCNYTENQAKYHKNYVKSYGETVVNYPFHVVMFQHKHFGDHLRKMADYKNKKYKHELEEQWRQNIQTQADFYKEIKAEDDQ